MKEKKYYIAHYDGSATYEPAEGGYYVPELLLSHVSDKSYKRKHARREFLRTVAELTEEFGEPDYIGKNHVHWTTGKYIGDEYAVRMTSLPVRYEDKYTGYC